MIGRNCRALAVQGIDSRRPASLMICSALLALVFQFAFGCLSSLSAQDKQAPQRPLVREIFVPFDDLNVLLESSPERVFLTRDEYEQLLKEAAQRPDESPPLNVALLGADYDVQIGDGRSAIQATIALEVLAPGLHAVPLDLSGAGLRSATLDGQPAALGRPQSSQVMLFVRGKGRHELQLELTTLVQTTAAQQMLQLQLPSTPSTQLHLTAPGNVELKAGAHVIRREVAMDQSVTRFELLAPPGPMSLVLSLNNRILRRERVMVARSVLIDEVLQGIERLHVTTTFSILHGAVEQLQVRLPADFEIQQVEADGLTRWSAAAQGDGTQTLSIDLRQPATEPVTARISAVRFQRDDANWLFPHVQPLEVEGHVAVLGLLVEQGWQVQRVAGEGLIGIDRTALYQALPNDLLASEPGAPQVRSVLAYYAPQPEYRLAAEFQKPPRRLDVVTSVLLSVDEKSQEVAGIFSLRPQVDRMFDVSFLVPREWTVTAVRDAGGQNLAFESFDLAAAGSRVYLRLPQAIEPGQTYVITFEAHGMIEGWVGEWTERPLQFPIFQVEEADHDTGALAVLAFDDLSLRPETMNQLFPLNNDEKEQYGLQQQTDLAFRYDAHPYAATFQVSRRLPNMTARHFSFLTVNKNGLSAHYEVIFSIREAGTRKLKLSLPVDTPQEVLIEGLAGTTVKEYTATVENQRRIWEILLAENVLLNDDKQGTAHLALDFQQPLPQEPRGYSLPLISAEGVEYQSGAAAVEGDAELEVSVRTEARKIDAGEMQSAQWQPGKRLLGTYGFVGAAPAVTVDVFRREGHGIPSAIAERAELLTAVAASGKAQTLARYHLRAKALLLEARLPPGAALWSVLLDDEPTTPQRDGDVLLINMPASSASLRILEIAYEVDVQPVGIMGSLETTAPHLLLPASDNQGQAAEVPIADLSWKLLLPKGYVVTGADGTVHWDESRDVPSPFRLVRAVAGAMALPAKWAAENAQATHTTGSVEPAARGPQSTPEFADRESRDAGYEMEEMKSEAPNPPPKADDAPVDSLDIAGRKAPAQPAPQANDPADDLQSRIEQLKKKNLATWSLAGVRSLRVDLENAFSQADSRRVVELQSLGHAPQLSVRVMDKPRVRFAAWAVSLAVLVAGLLLTARSWRTRIQFLVAVLVLALVLPALLNRTREWDDVAAGTILSAFLLTLFYVGIVVSRTVLRWCGRLLQRFRQQLAPATAALILLGLQSSVCGDDLSNIIEALQRLEPGRPVVLPADAIIIPYDPSIAGDPRGQGDQVMVPYQKYVELWNRAHPDEPLDVAQPATDYALAGSTFAATLGADSSLEVRGVVQLDIFVDRPLAIPLPFMGGVLTSSRLDGSPAQVQVVQQQAAPTQQQAGQQQAGQQQAGQQQARQGAAGNAAQNLLIVHTSGIGRKQLELTMQMKVERSGGWRTVSARFPAAPAAALTLTAPQAGTEVRLPGVADRSVYETTADGEQIHTSLLPEQVVQIQWRPKVAEGQVDRALTVESDAVLDIQEDGLRLAWQTQLQFRRGRREDFSFLLPQGYLVERVLGANVRGWTIQDAENGQRLDVTLLRAAAEQESITIYLSRHLAVGGEQGVRLAAPVVHVMDAALHHGQITVRRSPLVELQSTQSAGVNRTDVDLHRAETLMNAAGREERPLAVQPFQAYRFSSVPFTLEFAAGSIAPQISADTRIILRIAERELGIECRFELHVPQAPVHQLRFNLPANFEIREVSEQEWVVTDEPQGRVLTVYLDTGRSGDFAVNVLGSLGARSAADPVPLPRVEVQNARRQEGQIVVQADPAYRVRPEQLTGCEVVPLERTYGWLQEQQRAMSRGGLALAFRSSEYSGRLLLARRTPVIRVTTLSNVHLTPRAVEETILLEFRVLEAGIQEIQFRLPARLAKARMRVPALRQKTVTPVADGEPNRPMVLVKLELQDELMDVIRIVVEHDQLLTSEAHDAAIPVVETGEVEAQYVTLQNSSRDEVVTADQSGIEELTRTQTRWRALADLNVTQGYVVRSDAIFPRLAFQTKPRQAIETVAARIGLAETILVVDESGAYRASQQFRLENSSEQYLEVELPEGASLWTAHVAGAPVKPTVPPGATGGTTARIPLVKTETGDADYPVVLIYAGRLPALRGVSQVVFPLIRTRNIHVERSQMTLHLPESHRWLNFQGASQRATRSEYLSEFQSYLGERLSKVNKTLQSGTEYDRGRAANNLMQLEMTLNSGDYLITDGSVEYRRQAASNLKLLQDAQQQVLELQSSGTTVLEQDNRDALNDLFLKQGNTRSRNIVNNYGNNFAYDVPVESAEGDAQKDATFNSKWFAQNRLGGEGRPGEKGAIAQAQVAGKPGGMAGEPGQAVDELQALNRGLQQRFSAKGQAQNQPEAPSPMGGLPAGMPGAPGMAAPVTAATDGRSGLPAPSRSPSSPFSGGDPSTDGPAFGAGMGVGGLGGSMQQAGQTEADFGGTFVDSGLASVTLQIPERGTVYYFHAPRGDVKLSAQALPESTMSRLLRTAIGLAIGLVAVVVMRRWKSQA
jgi:hypothetical protein